MAAKKENYLILLRHGESFWNRENKFTGWVDIPLTDVGIMASLVNAIELSKYSIGLAFCSNLFRSKEALAIVLSARKSASILRHDQGRSQKWYNHFPRNHEIPIIVSPELNERYYGNLQGLDKAKAAKTFGKEKVFRWRRGYHDQPPGGESLADTYRRVIPYFKNKILTELKQGKNIIVSAHGNSLRTIIKYIDKIPDHAMPYLEFDTGSFVTYRYKNRKLSRMKYRHSFKRPLFW
mgnify:FL=1